MSIDLAEWSIIFLCFSMASALGEGYTNTSCLHVCGVRRHQRPLPLSNPALEYSFKSSGFQCMRPSQCLSFCRFS